jgi:hypothetical protein
VPGHIAIGQPYTPDGDPAAGHESHCAIEIDGLHSRNHPIINGGSLQALLLAIQFAGSRLHDFVSRGGRVLDAEDESNVPLAAFFGSIPT